MDWWVWLIIGVVVLIVLIVVFSGDDDPPPPSGGYRTYSGGTKNHNSSSSPLSDERLKTNIAPISNALEKVLMLQGVTYEWKRDENIELNFDSNTHIGFLAQELIKVLPDVVSEEEGYKRINYIELVALLTEAIKEQQKEINELRSIVVRQDK